MEVIWHSRRWHNNLIKTKAWLWAILFFIAQSRAFTLACWCEFWRTILIYTPLKSFTPIRSELQCHCTHVIWQCSRLQSHCWWINRWKRSLHCRCNSRRRWIQLWFRHLSFEFAIFNFENAGFNFDSIVSTLNLPDLTMISAFFLLILLVSIINVISETKRSHSKIMPDN